MASMRSVQDRFWSDGWVRKLNPLDRYLFLYLLTNEHTNWCGLYELDLGMMAFESGIDERDLEKSMLPRLAPKAIYVEGWIYIPNWMKHHLSNTGTLSPTQKKGFEDAWKGVPERIRLIIKEIEDTGIPYAYPIGGVSPSASAFTSASAYASAARPRGVLEYVLEEEADKPTKKEKKDGSGFDAFWSAYPKKANKVSAFAAWKDVHKDERDDVIADVISRCSSREWKKNNGDFIPLAVNYLKDRRWEDEGVKTVVKEKYEKYA